jgi:hypothetical protein
MKQGVLFKTPPAEKTNKAKAFSYDDANLRSARDILADPERYGGPESGVCQWAKAVIQRLGEGTPA